MIYDKNIKLNKIEDIKKNNILQKEKRVFNNIILLRTNIDKKKKNLLKLLYNSSKLKTTGCQRKYKKQKMLFLFNK